MKKYIYSLLFLSSCIGMAQNIDLGQNRLPEHGNFQPFSNYNTNIVDEECSQLFTSDSIDTGFNSNVNYDYRIANDFQVEEGKRFNVNQITVDFLILDNKGAPTFFNIYLLNDFFSTPGEMLSSYSELTATSTIIGTWNYGNPNENFNVYHSVIDVSNLGLYADGTEEGVKTRYWLAMSTDFTTGYHTGFAAVYPFVYDEVENSMPFFASDDGGVTYGQWGVREGFFSISGECVDIPEMGTSDVLTKGVKVYPNPVKDILNIEAKSNLESVSVYDVTGKLIKTLTPNLSKATLNLSDLQAGVYFVKYKIGNQVKTEKVIKK